MSKVLKGPFEKTVVPTWFVSYQQNKGKTEDEAGQDWLKNYKNYVVDEKTPTDLLIQYYNEYQSQFNTEDKGKVREKIKEALNTPYKNRVKRWEEGKPVF